MPCILQDWHGLTLGERMNTESLENLRAKFQQGIRQAEEMIDHIQQYRITGEASFDESIELQQRVIANYSGSIAFIDRYLAEQKG